MPCKVRSIHQKGRLRMIKSWYNWLTGNRESDAERRVETPSPANAVAPDDIDPTTGALRWERFLAMFNDEQEQAPGVLLVIDLSTHSESIDMVAANNRDDILPWLAQAIRAAIRSDDLLAHVSEYRFAALLRAAPQDLADSISRRIMESVDNTIFMTTDGIARLGVTIGGSRFGERHGEEVINAAMANLELAKSSGAPSVIQ